MLAPHLAQSSTARQRFAREAQAAAAVLHPNVIPIFNVESDVRQPYLVMQFIAGPSLQTRVNAEGPLPIADVLRIAQQTAAGLAAAHEQGLIHRDVKPANILLEEHVNRVVLSDFGLARTVDDAALTHTGIVTGTPHYMSPEQARGDAIDCRSDLFSLGAVIYFMIAGRPPFRAGNTMGVLNRICHDPHRSVIQHNPQTPPALAKLVDRLLAKAPSRRAASAAMVERELAELLVRHHSGRLRPARSARRLGWMLAGFAALAAALWMATTLWQGTIWREVRSPSQFAPPEDVAEVLAGENLLPAESSDAFPFADAWAAGTLSPELSSDIDRLQQDLAGLENEWSRPADWLIAPPAQAHAIDRLEESLHSLQAEMTHDLRPSNPAARPVDPPLSVGDNP